MSTYYFIHCKDCNEMTDAASRTAGGYCHLGDSEWTLLPFIIAHSGHNVDILSEDFAYDTEALRWTEGNVKEMVGRATESGDWFNCS